MKSPVLLLALMVMILFGGVYLASAFAMHDSTLDVNTWIASDNSTQLHTTDLNRGPISPAVSAGAAAEDTTGPSIVTPTAPDADEEAAGENGDEDEDQEESADEEEDDEDE
jgi:hypothetical protein